MIEEFVPVRNGQVVEDGDCSIAGIDGTAAELKVNFLNPAGAKTGKLLPTSSVRDDILLESLWKTVTVSAIDISNVFVFIRAPTWGCGGMSFRRRSPRTALSWPISSASGARSPRSAA